MRRRPRGVLGGFGVWSSSSWFVIGSGATKPFLLDIPMTSRSLMMIVSFDSEYNLNKPVTTIRSPRFLLLRMRKGQDKQGAVDQVQPVRSPLTTVFPNMCSLPSQGYIKISDILLYMIWQGISDLPELMPGREGLQKSPL